MAIHLHINDLPPGLAFGDSVAIDSEAMGLQPHRDRLCLVQMSRGDGDCHMVHFPPPGDYSAPNLKAILGDPSLLKMFHFARFDVAILEHYLGVTCKPVYCTKIASKLARTYTDRHGLKDLCRELLGIDISKQQQSSDWGAAELTPEQQAYAAADVLHLHEIKTILNAMLAREGRTKLAQACFDFLPHRARLDLIGWDEVDIFHH
ncbi:MAG: ribonuclease D [Alphaproteobacteria bacterium]